MSAEKSRGYENLGIHVPLAPTIVISTHLLSNKGPHGEGNYVDVQRKNTSVWLTTPGERDYAEMDIIIGPDGMPSPIGIQWTEAGPVMQRKTEAGFQPIGTEILEDVQVVNLPEGEKGFVLAKHYPGMVESYTIFQVMPEDLDDVQADSFVPYVGKNQLISGSHERGFGKRISTFLLAIDNTGFTALPFGRELKPRKP